MRSSTTTSTSSFGFPVSPTFCGCSFAAIACATSPKLPDPRRAFRTASARSCVGTLTCSVLDLSDHAAHAEELACRALPRLDIDVVHARFSADREADSLTHRFVALQDGALQNDQLLGVLCRHEVAIGLAHPFRRCRAEERAREPAIRELHILTEHAGRGPLQRPPHPSRLLLQSFDCGDVDEIGRASCRERV